MADGAVSCLRCCNHSCAPATHLTPHTTHFTPNPVHVTPHTTHLIPNPVHVTPHTTHLTPHPISHIPHIGTRMHTPHTHHMHIHMHKLPTCAHMEYTYSRSCDCHMTLPPCIRLLKGNDTHVLQRMVNVLEHLGRDPEMNNDIREAGGIPLLLHLLQWV